ncbi:MAG: PIN domain-containing protein [Vicinamibacteria bacterium]|nr:PIN domain-containing protein [Vicinamibacteria bacterium]
MALARYCLDTSAYSHFKRGHGPVVHLMDHADWIGVPTIVLGELWMGFGLGDRARRNERELRAFLANPVVEILAVDAEVARLFGAIAGGLRRRGAPLPTNDIWIAATSASAGATLLTYDEHFRRIEATASRILKIEEE